MSDKPRYEEHISHPGMLRLARGYWSSERKRTAWMWTLAITVTVIANVGVQFGINRWNALFFNALENKALDLLAPYALLFGGLVVLSALVNVGMVYGRIGLQVSWREWLTKQMVTRWLDNRNYYKLNIVGGDHDNPEFRISDDVRLSIEPLVDFAIGFFNAFLAAVTFLGVLWVVGGSLKLGSGTEIPGAFVLAALAYAFFMSGITIFIGRPLIHAMESKNGAEASLRFELTRVRESAESIALTAGEDQEKERLWSAMGQVVSQWWRVIHNHGRLTLLINVNTILLPVFPLLIGAPKYVSGEMSLGSLMQATAAFVQVQMAFNWIMDNFVRLAEWRASANRVMGLVHGIDKTDAALTGAEGSMIEVGTSPDDNIHLTGVVVRRDDGTVVIDDAETIIAKGESVMITGESGTGKSTLIRAIAGLWPWGAGKILLPERAKIAFLPQRSYMPLGTLKAAITYPSAPEAISDQDALDALNKVGLEYLAEKLSLEERWDNILSGGEQQRVAFARLLIAKPDIVVMDEATSALDEGSQSKVMEIFQNDLQGITLLSVAHRPSLGVYHKRKVSLKRMEDTVTLDERTATAGERWQRWRKTMSELGRIRNLPT